MRLVNRISDLYFHFSDEFGAAIDDWFMAQADQHPSSIPALLQVSALGRGSHLIATRLQFSH
jgi:hypothetical protein